MYLSTNKTILYHIIYGFHSFIQALGNHEFDNNIEGLLPFLQNANFTILSSNINLDSDPRIKPYVKKSYVTEVGGEKIGVIGYTTKDTPMISQPGEWH